MLRHLCVRRLERGFFFVDRHLEFFDRVLGCVLNLFLARDLGLMGLELPRRAINLFLQFVGETAQPMDFSKEDGGTGHGSVLLLSAIRGASPASVILFVGDQFGEKARASRAPNRRAYNEHRPVTLRSIFALIEATGDTRHMARHRRHRSDHRDDEDLPKVKLTRQTVLEALGLYRYVLPYWFKFSVALAHAGRRQLAGAGFSCLRRHPCGRHSRLTDEQGGGREHTLDAKHRSDRYGAVCRPAVAGRLLVRANLLVRRGRRAQPGRPAPRHLRPADPPADGVSHAAAASANWPAGWPPTWRRSRTP